MVNKILKKLCKITEVLKDQSDVLVEIQKQTYSTDIEYVKAQKSIKAAAESIIKIMEQILKEN